MDKIIIVVLALVVLAIMIRLKINIGWIMLVESGFIILESNMGFETSRQSFIKGITYPKTISTIFILFIIAVIENIMRKNGMINMLVTNLKNTIRSRFAASVTLPVILGLLPSAGGARFSCPMVAEVLEKDSTDLDMAFINYWYRHVWLDSFIMYPGIILTSKLTNISVITLFVCTLVFCMFHFAAGIFQIMPLIFTNKTIFSSYRQTISSEGKRTALNFREFFEAAFPIILVIIVYLFLYNIYILSLEISCVITTVYLIIYKRYSLKAVWQTFKESFNPSYVVIIIGVMVFSEVLVSSALMDRVINHLIYLRFPVIVLFCVLPFIVGIISGISVAFVSLIFPILIPLGLFNNVWLVVLSYVCGIL